MATVLPEWLLRRAVSRQRPRTAPLHLERRRIYILPTGFGYLYALMLLVMFLWAINYNNSMGFTLTFLLGAVALNTMWRVRNNLLHLKVYPGTAQAVFAGQQACFVCNLENPDPVPRYGIALHRDGAPPQCIDIPERASAAVSLAVPAPRRGLLPFGRLGISTRFPLGLFRAWSWVEFGQTCLIYPRPRGHRPLPTRAVLTAGGGASERAAGTEDYAGLRLYKPGDSPRHVAWKAAARASHLLVKHFADQARPELWLDWQALAPDAAEARLSQLCQWVLKAEAEDQEYGLRLPGVEIAPGRGEGQRRRCLEALALYGIAEPAHG